MARWLLLSLGSSIHSSPWSSWRSIRCNLLLRCVCRDLMNCGFMIRLSMNLIWVSSDLSYAWFHILVIFFEMWVLSGQLDLWFLQYEKCLVLGSYHAVTSPSDRRGSGARIVLLPSRVKRWGFHHWFEFIPLYHVISLKALLCSSWTQYTRWMLDSDQCVE